MSVCTGELYQTHVLHGTPLDAARLASRTLWVWLVAVLFGDIPIIRRIGIDDHSDCSGFLGRCDVSCHLPTVAR